MQHALFCLVVGMDISPLSRMASRTCGGAGLLPALYDPSQLQELRWRFSGPSETDRQRSGPATGDIDSTLCHVVLHHAILRYVM